MTELVFKTGEIPEANGTPDETPAIDSTELTGSYNPEYPGSTEEHPYGYFAKPDGSPDYSRPRKRKPYGARTATGSGIATSTRADGSAKTAAAMLARMNNLLGLAFMAMGLPQTREALVENNKTFEEMAYEALLGDPQLARKILSAGASSAKAQLGMAYVVLAGSVSPTVYTEFKERRNGNDEESEDSSS